MVGTGYCRSLFIWGWRDALEVWSGRVVYSDLGDLILDVMALAEEVLGYWRTPVCIFMVLGRDSISIVRYLRVTRFMIVQLDRGRSFGRHKCSIQLQALVTVWPWS